MVDPTSGTAEILGHDIQSNWSEAQKLIGLCPQQVIHIQFNSLKGSSINDVTVLGGRGYRGFCHNSTKALVIKSVTMG